MASAADTEAVLASLLGDQQAQMYSAVLLEEVFQHAVRLEKEAPYSVPRKPVRVPDWLIINAITSTTQIFTLNGEP